MKSGSGRAIKTVFICLLLFLITPLYAATPWLHTDANTIKDPNGNVVVLRGVDLIDLGFLESWQGGAINMIDRLTNKSNTESNSPGWYPRVIRIMVAPPDSASGWPHPFSPDNNDLYNLLRSVVDYCGQKDMYAIVDWHYVANTYEHVASTSAFWNYMAPKFTNDSHVIFELFNEPINTSVGNDTQDWLSVRNDMQTWINIVRSYAPNNLILVAGPSWSQVIGPAASYPLEGDNIAIVSHIYPGHWLTAPAGDNWYTTSIDTCLTRYPVFMSEWGFTLDANYDDSWHGLMGADANFGQPIMNFRETRQISNSAWVASYDWGPPMFHTDWTLRVGSGEMGGFVKDKLYEKRNSDQPGGGDTTAPDAPAQVTDTNGYGEVILDWDDNTESDIYGYNVYRSVVSGDYGQRLNSLYLLKDSNFIDKSVVSGITYYYVVTAVDVSFNESEISDEVSATPIGGAIYTFDGITQSNVDYDAYACDVDVFPFGGTSANRNTMVEATDANYASITAPDSADWTTVNPGSGDQMLIWAEMKINEPNENIAKIDLTFNGYTTGSLAANHKIYAKTTNLNWPMNYSWVQLGTDQGIYPGVYTSMTRSIGSNFGDYIDSDGNFVWVVYEAMSWQEMHVDYLGMVVYGQGFGNPEPAVYITSPSNGALFARDSNLTIGAYASDADGRVAKVEFYQGQTKLGEDTLWPFTCTWNSVPTGQYVLTAKVIDDDNNVTTSHDVNITVLGDIGTGAVLREWWTGISGTAVSDLTSNGNYPNQPTGRGLITTLQGPTNWADNYGTRIRGFLRPVADGNYTFTIAADDSAELWLAADDNPANASLIAESPAQEESLPISLTSGGKYYIEVLHKAGVGGDNISVSWERPGVGQQVIDGMFLSPFGLKSGDFARFATQWYLENCAPANGWCGGADFSRDGSVLMEDLKSFAESWLDGI